MGTGKQSGRATSSPTKTKVDKVRASRDGHEFHETWVARRALQLLRADSSLCAIAVEGLSPSETANPSKNTDEIADVVLYYGDGHSFEQAGRTVIAQFKYSVAKADAPFRASDAKKTLKKFATAYLELRERHGAEPVSEKLEFQYVTNRPVYADLEAARDELARGAESTANEQVKQFAAATELRGDELREFAHKCRFLGKRKDLPTSKRELASIMVDWSSGADLPATARLGRLREMVRDKCGTKGQSDNLVTRTDVLTVLDISDPSDLLPCPTALPKVGPVVERQQLEEATARAVNGHGPLLVHAPGGCGKTVFLESLFAKLSETQEVVFFDCFGGGRYRSRHDARHRLDVGLIHLGNTLAFRGLCEPILPGTPDELRTLRTFRYRLEQSVAALRRLAPDRCLVLIIDAIDNAEFAAAQWGEKPFPRLLLESLHDAPINGVRLVVSSRSERKPKTYAQWEDFELRPFGREETRNFVLNRQPGASELLIEVAHAKSAGNPRVLDYLLQSGELEDRTGDDVSVDELIEERIQSAIDGAKLRGTDESQLQVFLGALVSLPPPVPIEEHAKASGFESSAVESFASDLSPLLERTNQGLLFRDEPTETYVISHFGSKVDVLRRIAENLATHQEDSVYAAESLPGLLFQLDEGQQLFQLAFDGRLPSSVHSAVGKRNIRRARLLAAARHAATKEDFSKLSALLPALSAVSEVAQRGALFVSDAPDLAVISQDADVLRRLHETRLSWPGSQHARRAIANTLLGDHEEASRNVVALREWTLHYLRQDHSTSYREARPEHPDLAAAPLYYLCRGQPERAAQYLARWRDWFAFELTQFVVDYLSLYDRLNSSGTRLVDVLVESTSQLGPLTALLVFRDLDEEEEAQLVERLAKKCRRATKLKIDEGHARDRTPGLGDGLRKAAALAFKLGRPAVGRSISSRAPHARVGLHVFSHTYGYQPIFAFVFREAALAAASPRDVHERDVLPIELYEACKSVPKAQSGEQFRAAAKTAISSAIGTPKKSTDESDRRRLGRDDEYRAKRFIDEFLPPLLLLTQGWLTF